MPLTHEVSADLDQTMISANKNEHLRIEEINPRSRRPPSMCLALRCITSFQTQILGSRRIGRVTD
jgi:hypothetical protein